MGSGATEGIFCGGAMKTDGIFAVTPKTDPSFP